MLRGDETTGGEKGRLGEDVGCGLRRPDGATNKYSSGKQFSACHSVSKPIAGCGVWGVSYGGERFHLPTSVFGLRSSDIGHFKSQIRNRKSEIVGFWGLPHRATPYTT